MVSASLIFKMKKKENKPRYRLFIQVRERHLPLMRKEDGTIVTPVKWEEVSEINLGSRKYPNPDIFGFKFEPIIYEDDDNTNNNPFKSFFDNLK
jgi:hypothetical protein